MADIFCTCPLGATELSPNDTALKLPSEGIVAAINKIANHSDCDKLQFDRVDWAFQDKKAYHIQLWLKTQMEDISGVKHRIY